MWIRRLLRQIAVWVGSLLGGLVAVFVASELAAPITTRHIVPRWRYYETTGGDPGLVIICLHGLWTPDYFDAQLEHLGGLGNVLVMKAGGEVQDIAEAAMMALGDLNLLSHKLAINGFSRGALDLLRLLELCLAAKCRVQKLVINAGPRPGAVRWPSKLVPWSGRVLRGGLLLQLVWQLYWRLQGDVGTGPRGVHIRSVITGIRDLSAIEPAGRFYPELSCTLIRHAGNDPRVHVCDDAWRELFPRLELVLIPGDGHGEYELYPDEFNRATPIASVRRRLPHEGSIKKVRVVVVGRWPGLFQ